MRDVTCIIKTFDRPEYLDRLLKSIWKFYPDMKVIVADDSEKPVVRRDVDYFILPYDVGLSAGRNFLMKQVKTEYFVLLDDDFIFTEQTDLEKMRKILKKNPDIDIIGGTIFEGAEIKYYSGIFDVQGETVTYVDKIHEKRGRISIVDLIFNFFMARTDIRDKVQWDDELKLAEHFDFFFNARGKIKVAVCNDIIVNHLPTDLGRTEKYAEMRGRAKSYFKRLLRKNNLKKVVSFNGSVIVN